MTVPPPGAAVGIGNWCDALDYVAAMSNNLLVFVVMSAGWTMIMVVVVLVLLLMSPQDNAYGAPVLEKITDQNQSVHVQDIMRLAKAAEMLNYMDENVDPCGNFYAFACGNWAKINPANGMEQLTTGLFESMSKAMSRKIELMLTTDPAAVAPMDDDHDKKVKDFFASCMTMVVGKDTGGGGDASYRHKLIEIIDEFGEMPALVGADTWDGSNSFDWLLTIARIAQRYDIGIILSLDVLPDYMRNTVNRLYLGRPTFALESRSMYVDNVTAIYRQKYEAKIADELTTYLDVEKALAKKVAHDIVEFETDLVRGSADEKLGLGLEDLSEMTTVAALQRKYAPIIDVERYMRIAFNDSHLVESLYEYEPHYQEHLKAMMPQMAPATVANYVFYTLISHFLVKMSANVAAQEKVCIDKTKAYFAKNLDNMIYRRYKNEAAEQDIALIWSELKRTFSAHLEADSLRWISARTRQLAADKLRAMKLEINAYKDTNFTAELGGLHIGRDDYVENVKNIYRQQSRQNMASLHEKPKPLDEDELLSYTPANVIIENKVRVPVSMLQPYYLWAATYPNALKFGTLGTLIGHELIHGFDDNGRKYDSVGNHVNWWDPHSAAAFNERTQCFVDQYSRYRYGGRLLPKSMSQSENIADNGGLRLAYASYLHWLQNAAATIADPDMHDLPLERLPMMKYNSRQLFFISYAQLWCNDVIPLVRDLQTSTDTHVPGMFRVIGTLSNYPEFANEFNCAEGTAMNRTHKCEIY